MADGVKVSIGGKEYTALPLNLRGLRRLSKAGVLAKLRGMSEDFSNLEEPHVEAVVAFVHAVLARAQPELTTDHVEDMVEVSELGHLIPELMKGAGFSAEGENKGES